MAVATPLAGVAPVVGACFCGLAARARRRIETATSRRAVTVFD